ncbi:MAG: hypothetical protein PHR25_02645 [Clostridia bacterium]|nr:hypothetical protein [Clostridia bacterium]MDD4375658.1 hypothetical protein [Clostridia bacterium]
MDENASRAVFIGVSVFVAMITITLIITFYNTAKESASVANRFDISVESNSEIRDILNKEKITGLELRYLMNYYFDEERIVIKIYSSDEKALAGDEEGITSIRGKEYWEQSNQQELDYIIRPNYTYALIVTKNNAITTIKAIFEN